MLSRIRKLTTQKNIKWTVHAAERIQERGISRSDILYCIQNGEVLEEYINDFPNPSCLILGYSKDGSAIHVVIGCDDIYVYIITAYYPDRSKFEADFKTRKEC